MTDDDDRRAAAKCTACGEIGIVRVGSDGGFEPVGQPSLCDCEAECRLLDADPADRGRGDGSA